jgi:hypothetical protein
MGVAVGSAAKDETNTQPLPLLPPKPESVKAAERARGVAAEPVKEPEKGKEVAQTTALAIEPPVCFYTVKDAIGKREIKLPIFNITDPETGKVISRVEKVSPLGKQDWDGYRDILPFTVTFKDASGATTEAKGYFNLAKDGSICSVRYGEQDYTLDQVEQSYQLAVKLKMPALPEPLKKGSAEIKLGTPPPQPAKKAEAATPPAGGAAPPVVGVEEKKKQDSLAQRQEQWVRTADQLGSAVFSTYTKPGWSRTGLYQFSPESKVSASVSGLHGFVSEDVCWTDWYAAHNYKESGPWKSHALSVHQAPVQEAVKQICATANGADRDSVCLPRQVKSGGYTGYVFAGQWNETKGVYFLDSRQIDTWVGNAYDEAAKKGKNGNLLTNEWVRVCNLGTKYPERSDFSDIDAMVYSNGEVVLKDSKKGITIFRPDDAIVDTINHQNKQWGWSPVPFNPMCIASDPKPAEFNPTVGRYVPIAK